MTARLRQLRAAIGGDVRGARGVFPGPGHSREDRSLSVWDIGSRVVVHSFAGDPLPAIATHLEAAGVPLQCGARLTAAEARELQRLRAAARAAEEADAVRKRAQAAAIWKAAKPIVGSAYLRARGIADVDAGLREAGDVMVARVVDAYGQPLGIHRTYTAPDGVARERRMLGRQAGGCVRLAPLARTLAIAEGIETALSYAQLHGIPCWSARSANGLEQWRPPEGVERVIIAADGDEPGMRAAKNLAMLLRAFVRVEIDAAPAGADWNDVLRGRNCL